MEAFKAVEKEMKTKAFSKEGLSAGAKLDPKEKEREETINFLSDMVDELTRQVETVEAETESLQAQIKKVKKDSAKADRVAELEHIMERHKWHIGKLELLRRSLENESIDFQQVRDMEESIKDYVENNQEVDFYEDDTMYDEFNLDEESGRYGVPTDVDRVSSQDNQSMADETPELPNAEPAKPAKIKSLTDPSAAAAAAARRPSQPFKLPLPALATLQTLPISSNAAATATMKPAPPPTKPPGEPLKYASAAAAAAASDIAGVGIAPLPPPAKAATISPAPRFSALPTAPSIGVSVSTSPAVTAAQPAGPVTDQTRESSPEDMATTEQQRGPIASKSRTASLSSYSAPSPIVSNVQFAQASAQKEPSPQPSHNSVANDTSSLLEGLNGQDHDRAHTFPAQTNGVHHQQSETDESIFHLPSSLQDLMDSYEAIKQSPLPTTSSEHQRLLAASFASRPDTFDAERPRHYKPQNCSTFTPSHYPQEPLPIFDDPRLYSRIDTDALFYSFYYRQGTYQQYLAAKALKNQSWRFHKQYQTWFQRHEEPKNITEDHEQGTYRFFDYESTWYDT